MVLDEKLCPCHELTERGEELYRQFLEHKADEIIFKQQHPFKWMFNKIKNLF